MEKSAPADNKHPPAPTVEDYVETEDDDKKPASNSRQKRSSETVAPKAHQTSDKRQPHIDHGHSSRRQQNERTSPAQHAEEPSAQAGAKDEIAPEPEVQTAHSSRRHSHAHRPSSSRRPILNENERSYRNEHHHEKYAPSHPCACQDCLKASQHVQRPRPGPHPLQQAHHVYTHPAQPHHGSFHPNPQAAHFSGGMPVPGYTALPPGAVPRHLAQGAMPAGRPLPPGVDPRFAPVRYAMTPPALSSSSMPPSLPSVGPSRSPVKMPVRPAIHQRQRAPTADSGSRFTSSKITVGDTYSAERPMDDSDHFSARILPSRQSAQGDFESGSYTSTSPSGSIQSLGPPMRPHPPQRATTSAVRQIYQRGHARSRSDYPIEQPYGLRAGHPLDFDHDHDQDHGIERYPASSWDQYSHGGHSDYGPHPGYPGGRRGSNSSGMTQQTSISDPDYRHVNYLPARRHDGYSTPYVPETYVQAQEDARHYIDIANGRPEERVTAETLRQLGPQGDLPHSNRSSHRRSQHSMSETSSRYRGAEGSVKLIMPIAAAEQTRIKEMGDREVTFRPTEAPGEVEVTISTVGSREGKYLRGTSSVSRAPTRSSGSVRRAAGGRADGQEQVRERDHRERGHSNRAPSSRR